VSGGAAREEAAGLLRQPRALLPLCLAARLTGSRAAAQQLAFADVDLQARGAFPVWLICGSALAWAFGPCVRYAMTSMPAVLACLPLACRRVACALGRRRGRPRSSAPWRPPPESLKRRQAAVWHEVLPAFADGLALRPQALVASGRDLLHEDVPLVGPEGEVLATLTLTVMAARALGSVAREWGMQQAQCHAA
jgi:hypothetical protein